jgi:hypothetical protein
MIPTCANKHLPGKWARSWHCTGRCSPGTPAPSSRHTFCHCGVCLVLARAGGHGRPGRVRKAPCLWNLLRPWCSQWPGLQSCRGVWRLRRGFRGGAKGVRRVQVAAIECQWRDNLPSIWGRVSEENGESRELKYATNVSHSSHRCMASCGGILVGPLAVGSSRTAAYRRPPGSQRWEPLCAPNKGLLWRVFSSYINGHDV